LIARARLRDRETRFAQGDMYGLNENTRFEYAPQPRLHSRAGSKFELAAERPQHLPKDNNG
jgi:hypothetical protein